MVHHVCKSDNSPILGDNLCKQHAHIDIDKLEQNQLSENKPDIQVDLQKISSLLQNPIQLEFLPEVGY